MNHKYKTLVFVHVGRCFLNLLRTIQFVYRYKWCSYLSGCSISLKNTYPREQILTLLISIFLFITSNITIANAAKLPSTQDIIKKFNLISYPGGTSGYYAITYKSIVPVDKASLLSNGFKAEKYTLSSASYYLLPETHLLKFHATKATKQYHHYLGAPMMVIMIHPNGKLEKIILGKNILHNQQSQLTIPGNTYVAAVLYKSNKKTQKLTNSNKYAFIGCTTAPSWEIEDCIRASRQDLIKQFPRHKKIIKQFT